MSFSNYLELKLLDEIVGKTAFTMPTAYLALFVGDPLDTGAGGSEVSGNNYARVSTAGGDWNAAASGSIDNANAITFPQASGSWGTVDYFAIFDAASAGNLLASGVLDSSKAVGSGDTPEFAAGAIVITLD
ncbi:hypothetical protein LCGC14_0536170 [marine sediment metagenome]|uniref:Uncharacterized protein n=1 Tax=marine sediment metagenome TaxID=412755 RepID=A0A0F9RU79_9ZZZZ